MIAVRTALAATGVIGAMYAAIALIYSPTWLDFSVGVIISAAAVTGIGLADWLER